MGSSNRTFGRRDVLKGAGAVGVTMLAAPHVASAQSGNIRIGVPTIMSGRVAILGESSRYALEMATRRFNEGGGLDGREVELVIRDTKASPDEAARITRELVNSEGCEIIIDAEASTGSFAVQEVIRQLNVLCLHTNSETTSLTADPAIRSATAFRCARQGIHDAVAGGLFAAEISKAEDKRRWMTCSPDYAYGRDNSAQFVEYLKLYDDQVEIIDQAWPKLFEADYTTYVTRILQQKPDALYSALWGGDLVAFVEQSNLYGLFGTGMSFFSSSLADPPVLSAIQQLPAGLHSVFRYDPEYPDTEENRQFAEDYSAEAGYLPTNWAWQNYAAAEFVFEALRRTGGATDGTRLADEVAGMEIEVPFAKGGKVQMRADDHTLINYPVAWGTSTTNPNGMTNWVDGDWSEILAQEKEWKARQGY